MGVLAPGTGMLPGVKLAVPAAQTPPQPSLGGSLLPSPAADRWQLHLGPCGRTAPSIPPGSGISTHLPRGERLQGLPLSVEWSPACCAPAQRRLLIPPFPSPSPPPPPRHPLPPASSQAVTRGQAAPGFDPSAAAGSGQRGRGAGRGRGQGRGPEPAGPTVTRAQERRGMGSAVAEPRGSEDGPGAGRAAAETLLHLSDPSLLGHAGLRLI